jgi:hypothetical protein
MTKVARMTLTSPRLSRRTLLRGAGVALGLPFLDAMLPSIRAAGASATKSPMRMVCVANPLGMLPEAFFPEGVGADYELPQSLAALAPQRDQLTIFSHLDHDISGGHRGVHAFLSGLRDKEAADWPEGNISVDQRAAESVGGQTRFPSLVVSAGRDEGEVSCKASWTRNAINIPPVDKASELFQALFLEEDAAARTRQAQRYELNASILDAVNEHAKLLEQKLGQTDRAKLDEYLTSVREVEKRLNMSREWLDRPKPVVEMSPPVDGGFTDALPMMYDLLALALQTDSTRVASLSIPGTLNTGELGLDGSYHGFSHHGKSPVLQKGLLVIEKTQMEQHARFLAKLRSIVEPGGETLLDRTMVLFGSGMGNASSHSNKDLPILLAGGGFRHGEHKAYPTEPHRRVPLCNLFTTMLQRFGVEIEKFNTGSGTLAGFEAKA